MNILLSSKFSFFNAYNYSAKEHWILIPAERSETFVKCIFYLEKFPDTYLMVSHLMVGKKETCLTAATMRRLLQVSSF